MDISKQAKLTLEKRVKNIEELIANKGIGSAQLAKARRIQRNVNLAVLAGGVVAIAGFTAWLLHNTDED
mgnify:CR=1 FL=1|jgi:hypothetical protein